MSNVYPKAKEAFLNGTLDLLGSNIKLVLCDNTYTYSSVHQFASSLTGIVATSGNLSSKTIANGVFDSADITLPAVPVSNTVVSVVGFKDTGTTGTSPLVFFIDGFFVNTSGGDITVQFDNGPAKIFAL